MQYPISQRPALILASVLMAMGISFLLLAPGAGAESPVDPIAEGTTGPAEAVSAAPAEAEPVADTDYPPDAASSDQPAPTPVSQQPSASESDDADSPSSTASETRSTAQSTPATAEPGPGALSRLRPRQTLSEPVGQVAQVVAETTRPATDAVKNAAQTLDEADPTAPVGHLAQRPLQMADRILRAATFGLLTPTVSQLPSLAAGPTGLEGDASPLPQVPGNPSAPSAGTPPPEQSGTPRVWLRPHLAEPGAAELPWLIAPNISGSATGAAGLPRTEVWGAALGRPLRVSENGAPANGKGPAPLPGLPDLPQLIASGTGASFIHIAALLALLALAAPAILRRLRETPGLRAPTPFVCALERPG